MPAAYSVTVRRVHGRADLAAFVDLPFRLYKGDPNWVPPLKASVRHLLDSRRHPFYEGGSAAEAELFLAWEGSRTIGRVAVINNHAHNRFHQENVAHFGFFECVDRPEVANALLEAAQVWARERELGAILGPVSPSTNYECGLLVQGFDRPPVVMMSYNPPYYQGLIEGAGFTKEKDLLAFISDVHGGSLERLKKLAERTKRRNPGLETRGANLKDFGREVVAVQDIYNSAWEKNWGFVPMSDGEIAIMAKELRPLVEPELLRFAFVDGEPAAFLLALPDWNPVLADLGGSPWRHPIRAAKHMLRTKASDMEGLRVITLGVKAEHRKRGLEGILFAEGLEAGLRLGYDWCEYSWILEDNELTKRTVRLMNGELYKTYRIFSKDLS